MRQEAVDTREERSSHAGGACPIGRASSVLGDRWVLLIMRNATLGSTRFDEFRSELGIADNILSNRLGRLVEAGLLTRTPYRDESGRGRHEYRLTGAGVDLLPVLNALAAWGEAHTSPAEPAEPMRILHATCGHTLGAHQYCEHCGREAVHGEMAWLRPWRSPEAVLLADAVSEPDR
ncbi:helix-turn-helix domain-containing protein [Streptomyces sp. NPDC006923]|uniref:winged helix-turn-helix transcriptional regulator n=1 Tax=Streptomyces sp. NPDC006923 TaxID=3155355 RepID=UPI0033FEDAE1